MKIKQLREIERRLASGDATSYAQIGREEGVDSSYVCGIAYNLGYRRQVLERLRHMVRAQDVMLAARTAPRRHRTRAMG